jgi:hypothetical protein
MGLDKKFLSESYKRMSDEELMSIASNDIKDLTPDAQEVLKEELVSRGMGNGIDSLIEIQTKEISAEKLDEYAKLIRERPCPICGKTEAKLNAVIIFTNSYENFVIACPACLKKQIDNAQAGSLGLGLIGGIGGTIKAVNQIARLQKFVKQIESDDPSEALKTFVKKRIGEIELYKNNEDKLMNMVKYPNAAFF